MIENPTNTNNTKVVKIDKEIHHKVKLHVAKINDGTTITEVVNKAVTEYMETHNIE